MGVVRVWRHHDTDHDGLIGDAFRARGFLMQAELIDGANPPSSLEGVDILLILGSSSSVYDPAVKAEWLDAEMATMGQAIAQGVPVFGICFGAQMLCEQFGGRVERAPEGEVGWFGLELEPTANFSPGPWFEYHFDHCLVPETASVVARSTRAVQAFTLGNHFGVQFHPEVDAAQLTDWFLHDEAARNGTIDAQAHIDAAASSHDELVRNADQLVGWFLARLEG